MLDQITTITSLLTALVTLGTLVLILKQIKDVKSSILSSTYQSIYEQIVDLDKFFFQYPEYKEYFYRNRKDLPEKSEEREKLLSISEILIDTFQSIYFQRDCVRKNAFDAQSIWMGDIYNNSPILREYVDVTESNKWYADEFFIFLKKSAKKAEKYKKVKVSKIILND